MIMQLAVDEIRIHIRAVGLGSLGSHYCVRQLGLLKLALSTYNQNVLPKRRSLQSEPTQPN